MLENLKKLNSNQIIFNKYKYNLIDKILEYAYYIGIEKKEFTEKEKKNK